MPHEYPWFSSRTIFLNVTITRRLPFPPSTSASRPICKSSVTVYYASNIMVYIHPRIAIICYIRRKGVTEASEISSSDGLILKLILASSQSQDIYKLAGIGHSSPMCSKRSSPINISQEKHQSSSCLKKLVLDSDCVSIDCIDLMLANAHIHLGKDGLLRLLRIAALLCANGCLKQ